MSAAVALAEVMSLPRTIAISASAFGCRTLERERSPPSSMAISANSTPKRSEEHTSELQSLMRISYAVFCLKKKNNKIKHNVHDYPTKIKIKNLYTCRQTI